jgi:predicted unusual protein kinase regulating ubiquinone biosynthesis (AarF/ABC1/UbiB family)
MSPETPLELKLKLSKLCSDSMLEMIFQNNFVHGDLHPGMYVCMFMQDNNYHYIYISILYNVYTYTHI